MQASEEADPLMAPWPPVRDFTPTAHENSYPYIDVGKADLSGKSVLITGASKGIGRATALSFAKAGCSKIAIIARSGLEAVANEIKTTAEAANRPAPEVLLLSLDVTSDEAVASAAAKVASAFSCLDVLVNNAGTIEQIVPLTESDPANWWWTWELNVKGVYLMCRAFMPLVLKSSTKTIINVSSRGAHMLMVMGYQTSKMAVTRMTESMALHYREQGLVAISIHPGDCLTNLAHMTPETYETYKHHFKDEPELAGDTMVWLSKERREWLNGRFVSVTWDMKELEGKRSEILERDLLKFRLTL